MKTFRSMGKERTILEPGKEVELYRRDGHGCPTRMWFAFDSRTRTRIHVDVQTKPFHRHDLPQRMHLSLASLKIDPGQGTRFQF